MTPHLLFTQHMLLHSRSLQALLILSNDEFEKDITTLNNLGLLSGFELTEEGDSFLTRYPYYGREPYANLDVPEAREESAQAFLDSL